MEMEEKKSSGLKGWQGIILGLVFGIVLTGVFAKGLYDGYFKEDVKVEKSEKNTNTEKKVNNLDITDSIVETNINKILIGIMGQLNTEYFKSTKVLNTSISNKLVYSTILLKEFKDKNEFTEAELEDKVKEYFGEDYVLKHQDYSKELCDGFRYDSANKKYIHDVKTSCGGSSGPHRNVYMITKAETVDDELIVNIKVLFVGKSNGWDTNEYQKYYSDPELTKEITGLNYAGYDSNKNNVPLELSINNFKKGGSYKLIMKKVAGDNYSFVSSEAVK